MKTSRILPYCLLLGGVAFSFYRCAPSQQKAGNSFSAVSPPLKGIDVPRSVFEVDAAAGDTIQVPGGTRIIIPANALVDASGKPVTGKVNISYREFQKAADIIASGIMMTYDTAGQRMNFETAGMLEINGAKASDNSPVFVRPGESIHIDLASYRGEEDFNFYALDTAAKNWNYISRNDPPTEKPAFAAQLDKTAPLPPQPVEPVAYDGKSSVFDLAVDYNQHPELEGYNGVVWQYAGGANTRNPDNEQWVYKENWSNVSLTASDARTAEYSLRLSNTQKSFETKVRPVLKGKNLEAARKKFSEKLLAFDKAKSARLAAAKAYREEANYSRSLAVNYFGTYNCDRFYHMQNVVRGPVAFTFADEDFEDNIENVSLYLIAGDEKATIRYPGDGSNFCYSPSEDNRIVALLPGKNKVAIIDAKEFRAYCSGGKLNATFKNFNGGKPVETIADLQQLIDKI